MLWRLCGTVKSVKQPTISDKYVLVQDTKWQVFMPGLHSQVGCDDEHHRDSQLAHVITPRQEEDTRVVFQSERGQDNV